MKHLGQDTVLLPSPLLSLVTMVPATTFAMTNNNSVSAQATEMTCVSLLKILHCMLSRNRSGFQSTTAIREKKSWGPRHSKGLINTDCLSNSNIRGQRAFHLKSNDAAARSDAKRKDFPFADNLCCEQTLPLPAFQLISKQLQ